jgi:hypothetical protein
VDWADGTEQWDGHGGHSEGNYDNHAMDWSSDTGMLKSSGTTTQISNAAPSTARQTIQHTTALDTTLEPNRSSLSIHGGRRMGMTTHGKFNHA